MPRHDPRPSYRCRATAEDRQGPKRCGRLTRNTNRCCWQHQDYAMLHPDTATTATKEQP